MARTGEERRGDPATTANGPKPHGLQVVLVQPEIPPNTGSIARLCAATRTRLHLVKPLGFSLEDRYLKRAGLDYWPYVDLLVHAGWDAFLAAEQPARLCCLSARAEASYLNGPYAAGPSTYLVFGGETRGLPAEILAAYARDTYRIPILSEHVRSLNLANAVSIVLYEALRQTGCLGESARMNGRPGSRSG